jgi:hypothetical protein
LISVSRIVNALNSDLIARKYSIEGFHKSECLQIEIIVIVVFNPRQLFVTSEDTGLDFSRYENRENE